MFGMKKVVAVAGIAIFENEYLILKRSPYNHVPDRWEFVYGGIKKGESKKSAILREVLEETGQEGVIKKKYRTVLEKAVTRNVEFYPHLVLLKSKNVTLSKEHVDYRWVRKEELLDYEGMFPGIVRLLE
jgi:8-oxo-dGTP diphosphatase